MKKVLLLTFALVLVIGLINCAGTGSRGLTSYGEERIIEVGYEKLCRATSDYLSERGFPILQIDFKTGIIKTDYRNNVGWAPPGLRGEKRAKIDAKVIKIDENSTRLVLEIFSEVRDETAYSTWELVDNNTREARMFYERFFESIAAKAQGRIRN